MSTLSARLTDAAARFWLLADETSGAPGVMLADFATTLAIAAEQPSNRTADEALETARRFGDRAERNGVAGSEGMRALFGEMLDAAGLCRLAVVHPEE